MPVASVLLVGVQWLVPSFIRDRFLAKFLITVLAVLVLVAAVGAVGYSQASTTVGQDTERQMEATTTLQADAIGSWVAELRKEAQSVASAQVVRNGDRNEVQTYFSARTSFDFWAVHSVDVASGRIEATRGGSVRPNQSLNGIDRPWAQASTLEAVGANGTVRVGQETYDAPNFDKRLVYVVAPTYIGSDRYIVVEGSVSDEIEAIYQPLDGQSTTVTHSDGSPIYASGPGIDGMPGRPTATDAGNATFTQGENRVYATAPMDEVGWHVVTSVPKSVAFAVSNTVGKTIAAIIGVGLVGLLVVGLVIGRQTVGPLTRLRSKVARMEDGDLDVELETSRTDEIGQLYHGFATMRDSLRERITEAEQARKEAEVSRAEAMEMNNYLQEKAEEYSATMQACSRGDLTRRMEPEGENDAMDQIAEDFNDMIAELEMTTGQLKTFAVEVEEGGRGVQQSAETVRDASEQVADSVQKISDDAYDQKERLQEISEEMDAIAAQLEDFAAEHPDVDFGDSLETIRQIAEMVGEAVDLGEQTMAESETVAGAAEEQAAELNEVSSRAEELVRYAQYLGDGLSNFETEEEHEFVFQTGAGSPDAASPSDSGDD